MKNLSYGRMLFGAAAVLFGVIALIWHDPDTWQTLREIWVLRFGVVIGGALMTLQVAGGLGVQHPRTAHVAALILAAVYFLFCLACVPDVVAAPASWEHYGSFFEQFSLLCGATALFSATEADGARAVFWGRL